MAWHTWIWVEDTRTGHRFDMDAAVVDARVKEGAVRVVPNYPVNSGPNAHPRPAKTRVDLTADTRTPTGTRTGWPPPPPPPPRQLQLHEPADPAPSASTPAERKETDR